MKSGKHTMVPAPDQDTFECRTARVDHHELREPDQPPTLREQVREARERAGLSLRKLARLLGIHRNTVHHFENGGDIHVDDLCRIVRELRVRKITLGGVTYIREDANAHDDAETLARMAADLRDQATALFNRLAAEATAAAAPEAEEEDETSVRISPI